MGIMRDIADRVREARKKKGLSARAVADAAGLTPSHVTMIETRRKGVREGLSSETLRKLANVLDVSIDWLVTGEVAEHGAPKSLPPTGT